MKLSSLMKKKKIILRAILDMVVKRKCPVHCLELIFLALEIKCFFFLSLEGA
jgi:hypothetical protein